jgi:hypothetical protein
MIDRICLKFKSVHTDYEHLKNVVQFFNDRGFSLLHQEISVNQPASERERENFLSTFEDRKSIFDKVLNCACMDCNCVIGRGNE